jgi:protein-tyrosine phosphatase
MPTFKTSHAAECSPKLKVLMVCLGNICRSPTAHGVLEKLIKNKELPDKVQVDSAGTGSYHLGEHPDPRSITAAEKRGYNLHNQVARQVQSSDFKEFDYILAMDTKNLEHLRRIAPVHSRAKLKLLLDYAPGSIESVPDPYFGEEASGFELVLDLVEVACANLLQEIEQQLLMERRT